MKKKTLVIGASENPDRYSNLAIHRLKKYNHEVLAFGLKEGEVTGVPIQTKLPVDMDIDTITLYINPLRQEAFYQDLIALQPDRVIFNPGTENPEFYRLLENAGIDYELACTLVLLSTDQY